MMIGFFGLPLCSWRECDRNEAVEGWGGGFGRGTGVESPAVARCGSGNGSVERKGRVGPWQSVEMKGRVGARQPLERRGRAGPWQSVERRRVNREARVVRVHHMAVGGDGRGGGMTVQWRRRV